jgi:transposase
MCSWYSAGPPSARSRWRPISQPTPPRSTGCCGIGRHIAQRLVADGETVVHVPPKLSAWVRVFATGQGRKTDPVDAHSVAVAALRAKGLRQVVDDETVVLRCSPTAATSWDVLAPTWSTASTSCCWNCCPAGEDIPVRRPGPRLLNTIRPRDLVGRTRRRLASELIAELVGIDKKIKTA